MPADLIQSHEPLPLLYLQAGIFIVLLLTASIVDIHKRRIPNTICILIAVAGLIPFSPAHLLGILTALPLLLAALYNPVGMGGGDIKLTAASGLVIGLPAGIFGLTTGLLSAILFYGAKKAWNFLRHIKHNASSALPLAPFLSIGFITSLSIQLFLGGNAL